MARDEEFLSQQRRESRSGAQTRPTNPPSVSAVEHVLREVSHGGNSWDECDTLVVSISPLDSSVISEKELRAMSSKLPGYKRLHVSRRGPERSAYFIEFEDIPSAIEALRELGKSVFQIGYSPQPLSVMSSQTPTSETATRPSETDISFDPAVLLKIDMLDAMIDRALLGEWPQETQNLRAMKTPLRLIKHLLEELQKDPRSPHIASMSGLDLLLLDDCMVAVNRRAGFSAVTADNSNHAVYMTVSEERLIKRLSVCYSRLLDIRTRYVPPFDPWHRPSPCSR